MKVIACLIRQCRFDSCTSLYEHISKYHRLEENFKCFFENCDRIYSLFGSFRKHVFAKHNLNSSIESKRQSDMFDSSTYSINQKTTDKCDSTFDSDSDQSTDNEIEFVEEWNNVGNNYINSCEIPARQNKLKDVSSEYVPSLYNLKQIPRKYIDSIIRETASLLEKSVTIIKEEMVLQFSNSNVKITAILDKFSTMLCHLDTEYKRLESYKHCKTFISPESLTIGQRKEFKRKNGILKLVHVSVNVQFIPLRSVFQAFFSLPEIFEQTMKYINNLKSNNNILVNVIQGNYWRNRSLTFENKKVLPLIIYFDEYENNNPLGSHKGIAKTGAMYVNIPALTPIYQDKLENIFLFLLFNSLDKKIFKNSLLFTRAIEEINFLNEYGIEINVENRKEIIHFEVILFLSDNLGLHSMLGFTESFRANIFCHHCLISQSEKNTILLESECTLRTVENYNSLIAEGNPIITGLKEKCFFHKINNFHMARNICVDAMHDLLEGICRYDLALILNYFIFNENLFTLHELNVRIQSFDYSSDYNINKPPELNEASLKKGYIILSSSEMLCLMKNLNLILGHLIQIGHEHWKLFLNLREIVLIVSSSVVLPSTHKKLEITIYDYLSLLKLLFPNNFKPKHHFLVHYPRMMLEFGPLWKLSSMRYESKHQEGKLVSKSSTNRINVNKSVAIKHQLYLNYRFMLKKSMYFIFESKSKIQVLGKDLRNYQQYRHLFNSSINVVFKVKSLQFYRKQLRKNTVIAIFCKDGPEFYKIYEILFQESKYLLITKKLIDYYFNKHFQCYKVNLKQFVWAKLSEENIETCVISNIVQLSDGFSYIQKNWM